MSEVGGFVVESTWVGHPSERPRKRLRAFNGVGDAEDHADVMADQGWAVLFRSAGDKTAEVWA